MRLTARAGPAAGVIIDRLVGRNLFLRLQPSFLRKGTDLAIEADSWLFPEGLEGSIDLDYLELPLLLGFSTQRAGLRPYVLAGPAFGYLLTAQARAQGEEEEITDASKRGDLSFTLIGGLQFPAGPASVFVEARLSQGLWTIFRDVTDYRPKHRGVVFDAGLLVPIGARSPAAEVPAASEQEREGFWMGFGLGYGLARASSEDGRQRPQCEDPDFAGGAGGTVALGWTITPQALLGAEATLWSGHQEKNYECDTFLVEGPVLGNASIAGYVYPLRTRGLFLKGGVGLSLHAPSREGVSTSTGWGWTAGVGYDFRVAERVSLTPSICLNWGALGEVETIDIDRFDFIAAIPGAEELAREHGVRQSVLQFALRITLH